MEKVVYLLVISKLLKIYKLSKVNYLYLSKEHGIKAVLTAAKGVFLNHPKTEVPYQLYIPGEDH
jgi:hypothetical protein